MIEYTDVHSKMPEEGYIGVKFEVIVRKAGMDGYKYFITKCLLGETGDLLYFKVGDWQEVIAWRFSDG